MAGPRDERQQQKGREGGQEEQEQDRKASKGQGDPAQGGEEQQRGRPNQEKRADKNEGGTLPLKTGTPQSSPTQWWGGRGGGHVPERMCDALDGWRPYHPSVSQLRLSLT